MRLDRLPSRRRVLGLVLVVVSCAILWHPFLRGVAAFMSVTDPPAHAAFILTTYGDPSAIPERVADLYRRQVAPRVLLHRVEPSPLEQFGLLPPDHVIWRRLLEAEGIPPDAIETVGQDIRNDVELGEALQPLVGNTSAATVVVVTSSPGSRNTRNALRRGLGDERLQVRMHAVTPSSFDGLEWWESRAGWIDYFDAYCLWLVAFLR